MKVVLFFKPHHHAILLTTPTHSAVRRQLIVSNPIKTLLFPTRLPQKNRAPGFETRKVAAQVGGEISYTIYLHLRPAVYVRNLDLKHKHLAKFCPSDWR